MKVVINSLIQISSSNYPMNFSQIFSVTSLNTGLRIFCMNDGGERFHSPRLFSRSRLQAELHILEGRIPLFARTTMASRPPLGDAPSEPLRESTWDGIVVSSFEAFFRRQESRWKRNCTFEAPSGDPFHSRVIRWKSCKCRLGGPLTGAASIRVCIAALPFGRRSPRRCI